MAFKIINLTSWKPLLPQERALVKGLQRGDGFEAAKHKWVFGFNNSSKQDVAI
jgi:hypothetical protein